MLHNCEELAELQQALSKWGRGKPDRDNILLELKHVKFVMNNIQNWILDYDWGDE